MQPKNLFGRLRVEALEEAAEEDILTINQKTTA